MLTRLSGLFVRESRSLVMESISEPDELPQGYGVALADPQHASQTSLAAAASDSEKAQQHQGSARNRFSARRRVNAVKLPFQAADPSWERLFQGEHIHEIRPA